MQKLYKKAGKILLCIIIILGCIWIVQTNSFVKTDESRLTIRKIAIVNLDDGVEIEGKYRYYASEFLGELDDNFEITGLEQAKRGMENNLYAAYLIIPAVFSQNIESINSRPTKSNIIYKINENLDYAIREKVLVDILDFNNRLSTNIEYVYVDAILRGVHTVQNSADDVMKNDLNDLKDIITFAETDLIENPEYPDEKHAEYNIEPLDLSDTYDNMQKVFSDLTELNAHNQTCAQNDYYKLIDEKTNIKSKMSDLNTEIEGVTTILNDDIFDDETKREIEDDIVHYNTELVDWRASFDNQVLNNFDAYMSACQDYTDLQLENLNMEHKNHTKEFYNLAYAECDKLVPETSYVDETDLETYKVACDIISELQMEIINMQSANNIISNENGEIVCIDNSSYEIINQQYEERLVQALKKDIPYIKEVGQKERNGELRKTITNWLKADLVYYGASEEEIEKVNFDDMDGNKSNTLIDDWYSTKITMSIESNNEESETEEAILENRKNVLFSNTNNFNEFDSQAMDVLISDTIIDPISRSVMQKHTELSTSYDLLDDSMSNWEKQLNEFSIDNYNNEDNRSLIENRFSGNLQNVKDSVDKKETEYETYAAQVDNISDINLSAWEKSIQTANTNTNNNINNGIENLKTNREKRNNSNNELMENVTGILPYSRIGELENRNVYSYIVSPIDQNDLSDGTSGYNLESKERKQKNNNQYSIYIILSGVIFCMVGGVNLVNQIIKRNKYLQRQNL